MAEIIKLSYSMEAEKPSIEEIKAIEKKNLLNEENSKRNKDQKESPEKKELMRKDKNDFEKKGRLLDIKV